MVEVLRYKDEADKSLGLAGMAISLVACDGERYLASLSLEEGDEAFELSSESFFSGNPRFSARLVWNDLFVRFQLSSGLLLGNVLCRWRGTLPPAEVLEAVHDIVREEGSSECSLDDDEIENVYNKSLAFYRRLFAHRPVIEVADSFADHLRRQRRMSAGEAFEFLSCLSRL